MKETQLPYCNLIFKESHAIFVMNADSPVTEITDHLETYYNGKNFICIRTENSLVI